MDHPPISLTLKDAAAATTAAAIDRSSSRVPGPVQGILATLSIRALRETAAAAVPTLKIRRLRQTVTYLSDS